MKSVESFAPLEERLVVDWGKNTNAWYQYYNNAKSIISVEDMPDTTGIPVFKSYLDTMLSYSELQMVVNNPDWVEKLTAVHCIYAILDNKTGELYVVRHMVKKVCMEDGLAMPIRGMAIMKNW